MGRKNRIQYYGAIYYINQRGKEGDRPFFKDEDKAYLLELINEAKENKDFKIFAYVIMDNCYQLLLQTLNIPISSVMHYVNFKYANYYNKKLNRTGPVFQKRYKSILVQDERFILPIIKYIHRYPVEIGLCATMEEYKWSSDAFYRVNMESVVNIEQVLSMFSPNRLEAIEKYIEYMEKEEKNWEFIKHMCENSFIIGTGEFIRRMEGKNRTNLEVLLRKSCPTEAEFKLIKKGSRERYLTKYKVEYISLGRREGYTYKEIGEYIGITGAAARGLLMQNK